MFDVSVNGKRVLKHVDVFAAAGGKLRAADKSFQAKAQQGALLHRASSQSKDKLSSPRWKSRPSSNDGRLRCERPCPKLASAFTTARRMNDPHNLQRFVDAQNSVYEQVCA